MATLLNQEIQNNSISARTIELNNISFKKADGSFETVSGTVEVLANGEHEVNISGIDILRLKLSMEDFMSASNAMSESALADNKEIIINLTQHSASDEQVEANVIEPTNKSAVQAAITFDAIPSVEEMVSRAQFLASIAKESGSKKAMIGGAPFFMGTLERVLIAHNITPVYAFSVRESIEKDGVKTSVFRHTGFVEL